MDPSIKPRTPPPCQQCTWNETGGYWEHSNEEPLTLHYAVAIPHERVQRILDERNQLAKFKAYVHLRLDQAGIPTHPNGPHSADGCRVGDRIDIVFASLRVARDALLDMTQAFKWDSVAGVAAGVARCRAALAEIDRFAGGGT